MDIFPHPPLSKRKIIPLPFKRAVWRDLTLYSIPRQDALLKIVLDLNNF